MSSSAFTASSERHSASKTLSKLSNSISRIHQNASTFTEACDVEFVVGREGDSQSFFAMGSIVSILSPVFR